MRTRSRLMLLATLAVLGCGKAPSNSLVQEKPGEEPQKVSSSSVVQEHPRPDEEAIQQLESSLAGKSEAYTRPGFREASYVSDATPERTVESCRKGLEKGGWTVGDIKDLQEYRSPEVDHEIGRQWLDTAKRTRGSRVLLVATKEDRTIQIQIGPFSEYGRTPRGAPAGAWKSAIGLANRDGFIVKW